jgi:hypothetical protein
MPARDYRTYRVCAPGFVRILLVDLEAQIEGHGGMNRELLQVLAVTGQQAKPVSGLTDRYYVLWVRALIDGVTVTFVVRVDTLNYRIMIEVFAGQLNQTYLLNMHEGVIRLVKVSSDGPDAKGIVFQVWSSGTLRTATLRQFDPIAGPGFVGQHSEFVQVWPYH